MAFARVMEYLDAVCRAIFGYALCVPVLWALGRLQIRRARIVALILTLWMVPVWWLYSLIFKMLLSVP